MTTTMINPMPEHSQSQPDMSIALLLNVANHSRKLIASITAGAMVVAFAVCMALPRFYAWETLIEVPSLGPLQSGGMGGMGALAALAGGKGVTGGAASLLLNTNVSTPDKDVKAYLDFKYVDSPRSSFSDKPYLKSVNIENTATYLRIVSFGKTFDEARAFADQIIADLKQLYTKKLDLIRADAEKNIEMTTRELSEINQALEKILRSKQTLGFSPVLLKEEAELKQIKIMLESSILQLQTGMSEYQMHNVLVADSRMYDDDPAQPKTQIIVPLAGILAFLITTNVLTFMRVSGPRASAQRQVHPKPEPV